MVADVRFRARPGASPVGTRARSERVSYCQGLAADDSAGRHDPRDWPPRIRRDVQGPARGTARRRGIAMAMTAAVKDELSRVPVTKMSARKAELATMLRFAGALHLVGGHIVIEAELDTGSVARRLRKEIGESSDMAPRCRSWPAAASQSSRYLVRVAKDGERLARQSGLIDLRGRPVSGCRTMSLPAASPTPKPRGAGRFRAWLAHRTRPGLLAGDHLPFHRGRARLSWGRTTTRRHVQGPRGTRLGKGQRGPGQRIGALLTRIGAEKNR